MGFGPLSIVQIECNQLEVFVEREVLNRKI